ncbi:hypothetical protein CTA2_2735 [Colletotrichum tanaceti]|uniref:Uncharacterized protein n=1 Tax=Colletotrichum tanaceti TaxID=1306861 RepID=A0A4U6X0C8_9PEZI|nr:hypothetical protein CTA2_2735 [Colletotrichum tanaceti]TKW48818.1 hypothetical protein CTA1_1495 [Colletotrichum tanaceti]
MNSTTCATLKMLSKQGDDGSTSFPNDPTNGQ